VACDVLWSAMAVGRCASEGDFRLKPDTHVLVVEDVWTTGGSTQEAISVVEEAGGARGGGGCAD